MIEEIKTVGSFVGLATGAFVLFDRFYKGRLLVSLTIHMDGTVKSPRMRFTNPSPYDIAITGATVTPATYFLTEDMENTVRMIAHQRFAPYFMLKAGTSEELTIGRLYEDGLAKENTPHRVVFKIYWRRGNLTWLPQIPVFVFTDTTTIRKYTLEEEDLIDGH